MNIRNDKDKEKVVGIIKKIEKDNINDTEFGLMELVTALINYEMKTHKNIGLEKNGNVIDKDYN